MPERIQLRRTKGWRKPESAVVVSRPGKFGNPFAIVNHDGEWYVTGTQIGYFAAEDRASAVAYSVKRYERWLTSPEPQPYGLHSVQRAQILNHLAELRGHDLACWCPLEQACHADVLLEVANGPAR